MNDIEYEGRLKTASLRISYPANMKGSTTAIPIIIPTMSCAHILISIQIYESYRVTQNIGENILLSTMEYK